MEMIVITQEQFNAVIDERLARAFEKFLPINTPMQEDEEYITRKQTAKDLKISLPTLSEYTKSGELIGYRIGGSIRYKKSEIKQALSRIKYSRDKK